MNRAINLFTIEFNLTTVHIGLDVFIHHVFHVRSAYEYFITSFSLTSFSFVAGAF